MKTKFSMILAALLLSTNMSYAAVDTDTLVSDLQSQGYSWIEVKRGPTQIKVEAVKGTVKVETIIDAETGEVLKSESETASADEQARTGVEVSTRDKDFIDGADDGDDSTDDNSDDSSDDSGDDDEGDDDNSGSGSGGDDDGDDDHSGSGGGDNDHDGGEGGDDHDGGDHDSGDND